MSQFLLIAKKPITFLLLGLVFYFSFGLSNITHYITADEHFWLPNFSDERIQTYWKSLAEGNWEDTRINDKPGVSTAIVSGIALPLVQNILDKQIIFDDGVIKRFDPEITQQIIFWFRLPLLLFNGLFIFYFFWVLKKITHDEWVALWASILILLSPITMGISQIVNPDTLFWSLGSATILTFFAYLQKRERHFIWIAVLLFGGTLLSKYVGVIFFPFFLAMIAIDYIFHFSLYKNNQSLLSKTVREDILAYAITLLGGTFFFALLMPAAIADPKVLYESTIGFPGMLPVFIAASLSLLFLLFDALVLSSLITWKILSFIAPQRKWLERILYGILFLAASFTLFNWMSRNSLFDLSNIPFDAKTKETFTIENPYPARFIAEWVPLVFALTPITLFLLIFSWAQAFFGSLRRRSFVFSISLFILVFYAAVIEQGLLVTVRYSIILFPLALILGTLSLRSLLFPKTEKELVFSKYIAPTFIFFFVCFALFVFFFDLFSITNKLVIEVFIGNHLFFVSIITIALISLFIYLLKKFYSRFTIPSASPVVISLLLLVLSITSLYLAYPHYFIYTNKLLPERYLLFHSWGYGGYEAAQYLNSKPNAKNMTLWVDSYGTCEFFVGNCIKKQKVDIERYPIDYILRTLRGTVTPRFPYSLESVPEWEYSVGGRVKNFVRIYRNTHE